LKQWREIKYRKRKIRKTNRRKPKDRTYTDSRRDIAVWWSERVSSGVLLDPEAILGEDYGGGEAWPEWITLKALHKQYTKDTGQCATRLEFCHRLRAAMGLPVGEGHYVFKRNKFGRIVGVEYNTIYPMDWVFRSDALDSGPSGVVGWDAENESPDFT
jgi:hypothetical protein